MNESAPVDRVSGTAIWVLTLVSLLMVASYLDRTILSLLVGPIKADLGIGDSQFALLYGAAFALFFGLIGVPVARYVDRGNRKYVILAGVFLWASATAASGLAQTFAVLLVLRMMLAVGEAALAPATASLIADLFPLRRRVIAATVFSAATQVGGQGSFIIGAMMISAAASADFGDLKTWQAVLVLASLPTFLLGFLFAATVREPRRRAHSPTPSTVAFTGSVRQKVRDYGCYLLGATGPGALLFAYMAWMPEMLSRTFGINISDVGVTLGTVGLGAGLAGTFVIPVIINRLAARRADAPVIVNFLCFTGALFLGLAVPLQSSPTSMLALYGAMMFLLVGGVNATLASLQLIVPKTEIGTLSALGTLSVTTLGLGLGPSAAAYLATTSAASDLNHGLAVLAPVAIIPSLVLLFLARAGVARRVREIADANAPMEETATDRAATV